MNCEMAEKYLSAYLDDMLDPQLRQEVEAHLESCAVCSEVVAEYRRFDTLLSEAPRLSPPPELRDRLFNSPEMAVILRQEAGAKEAPAPAPARAPRRSPTRGSPPRWTRVALQSAAVIAIIVGSALLFKQGFFHSGTTTTGHTSTTPAITGPTQAPPAPLGAGRRVVYEHGGALWSAPEEGPDLGQQLNPTNISVSTIWSVSPGGKLVAYAEAGTGRIHIIRSDGQKDTATSSFSAICGANALCTDYPPTLAWSPNGRYIAYQSVDGTLHLLTVADTSDQIVSAGLQGIVTSLLWSSDSQQLAFLDGQAESIWSFSPASGELSRVSASPDSANSAATIRDIYWLADTQHPTLTWTAWVASTQSLTGIFSGGLVGGSPVERLSPSGLKLTGAGFTPHQGGVWLVAAINQGGTPELGTIAASHPGLQITNATPQITINEVYWSPLGDTAALVTTSGQMFLATDNGASLSPSELSNVTGAPAWSADGSHLATPLNIGIISLDIAAGSPKGVYRLLPSLATPASATMLWSPDSQDIAIATSSGIYLTSFDGKNTKQVDPQTAAGLFGWSFSG